MNKTKMILAGTGGAAVLVVLVLAFLTWLAYSEKTAAIEGDEENEGLETAVAKAGTLSRSAVYPCAESVTAINSNKTLVAAWGVEARQLAASGDKSFEATTPAAFKAFIMADAKRLTSLPGRVEGKLTKPDFAFGPFKDYIAEGKLPADAELAELQRRWDDVATVVATLAESGIAELTDVQFKATPVAAEPSDKDAKKKLGKKGKVDESAVQKPAAYSYAFTFTAKPAGFIKAINALGVGSRFTVVDDFTFSRASDVIATALGGEERKADANQGGRGRGRRRGAFAEEQKTEAAAEGKNGIITDPVSDAPMTVVLNVTVYDFRSSEGNGEAATAATEEKGTEK